MLISHAAVFGLWWWLMPGGFPLGHLKFWSNTAIPAAGLLVCLTAPWLATSRSFAPRIVIAASLAGGWMAFAASAAHHFPVTFPRLWMIPTAVGAVMASIALLEARLTAIRLKPALFVSGLLFGAVPGVVLAKAQRSAPPATRSSPGELPAPREVKRISALPIHQLSPAVRVSASDGTVSFTESGRQLTVAPLLTFLSCSPDACWTLFAPRGLDRTPPRQLTGVYRQRADVTLEYEDQDRSILTVLAETQRSRPTLHIHARSNLPRPVWSHLNSFTTFSVKCAGPLALSFSPCPEHQISVRPISPGSNRVAEFAYFDAGDVFRIAKSSNREKGPFQLLASGPLPSNAPFGITIFDNGLPVFGVSFRNWQSQASTQLSPTAGWGVPENAIEIISTGENSAEILMTLAGTSVGRGFDSVGHAPGICENFIFIHSLSPAAGKSDRLRSASEQRVQGEEPRSDPADR